MVHRLKFDLKKSNWITVFSELKFYWKIGSSGVIHSAESRRHQSGRQLRHRSFFAEIGFEGKKKFGCRL